MFCNQLLTHHVGLHLWHCVSFNVYVDPVVISQLLLCRILSYFVNVYVFLDTLLVHVPGKFLSFSHWILGIHFSYGTGSPVKGSVLVFLPGLGEISDMEEKLRPLEAKKMWRVIPLHSSITGDEQALVFKSPEPGQRKVILSTNIAESSITVPDIKYGELMVWSGINNCSWSCHHSLYR